MLALVAVGTTLVAIDPAMPPVLQPFDDAWRRAALTWPGWTHRLGRGFEAVGAGVVMVPLRIAVAAWLVVRRRRWDLAAWLLGWVLADVVSAILKPGLGRERPDRHRSGAALHVVPQRAREDRGADRRRPRARRDRSSSPRIGVVGPRDRLDRGHGRLTHGGRPPLRLRRRRRIVAGRRGSPARGGSRPARARAAGRRRGTADRSLRHDGCRVRASSIPLRAPSPGSRPRDRRGARRRRRPRRDRRRDPAARAARARDRDPGDERHAVARMERGPRRRCDRPRGRRRRPVRHRRPARRSSRCVRGRRWPMCAAVARGRARRPAVGARRQGRARLRGLLRRPGVRVPGELRRGRVPARVGRRGRRGSRLRARRELRPRLRRLRRPLRLPRGMRDRRRRVPARLDRRTARPASRRTPGPGRGPGDRRIVVAPRRRSPRSRRSATTTAKPAWTGRTNGPATSVAIGDGFAFTVARGQLLAFPLGCSGRCEPAWRARIAPGASAESATGTADDERPGHRRIAGPRGRRPGTSVGLPDGLRDGPVRPDRDAPSWPTPPLHSPPSTASGWS